MAFFCINLLLEAKIVSCPIKITEPFQRPSTIPALAYAVEEQGNDVDQSR